MYARIPVDGSPNGPDQSWGTFFGARATLKAVNDIVFNSFYSYFAVIGDIITFLIHFFPQKAAGSP